MMSPAKSEGLSLVVGESALKWSLVVGARQVGFVDDEPHLAACGSLGDRLGTLVDLPAICEANGVDRVLVAFSRGSVFRRHGAY